MKLFLYLFATFFVTQVGVSQTMYVHTPTGTSHFLIQEIDSITFSVQPSIPTDSLVAYYSFNGNARDTSGHGLHGVPNGVIPTTDSAGHPQSAYFFNGASWVSIASFPTNYDSVTVCAWIKANRTSNGTAYMEIFDTWASAGHTPFRINLYKDSLQFWMENGFAPHPHTNISYQDTSAWHFVCGRRIKSGSNYTLEVWLDGQLKNSNVTSISPYKPSTVNASIGKIGSVSGEYFFGKIDEIRIYKRALSDTEIQMLYHAGGQ